jgi:hypothetical protein
LNFIDVDSIRLAGGDWNKYGRLLEDFAERVGERGVSVILYRLGQ